MNPECHGHFHGTLTIDIVIPVAAGRPGDVGIKSGEGSGQEKKGSTVHRRGDRRGDRKSGAGQALSLNPIRLKGFEPLTYGLEVRCSIQLSYRRARGIYSFSGRVWQPFV